MSVKKQAPVIPTTDTPTTEPVNFCVVPMHKNNWDICIKHAKILSNFLRSVGLDHCRFAMQQRHSLQQGHQGNTTLTLEIEEGRHGNDHCVIKISSHGESTWPYVLKHDEHDAGSIHSMMFKAMGQKEKIHLTH